MGNVRSLLWCVAFAACAMATVRAFAHANEVTQPNRGFSVQRTDEHRATLAQKDSVLTVLHRFRRPATGAFPRGSLISYKGKLFGMTQGTGPPYQRSMGNVYAITPSGHERAIYSFVGGSDGAFPDGALIEINGTFYGLTSAGGVGGCSGQGCGTVFKVTPAGVETVLYRFKGAPDAASPYAGLIDVNGTLYGTTLSGGTYNHGTVFSVTTSGAESVLYSFGSNANDGTAPGSNLTNVGGVLYGTTIGGGPTNNGTAFSLTTLGVEHVIYNFKGGSDGSLPYAALLYVGGMFYGATAIGGTSSLGTVFALSLSGAEKVLHSFRGSPTDGNGPDSAPIESGGKLYGVTQDGGSVTDCEGLPGCGTIYEIAASGSERVVHSFTQDEGLEPDASLLKFDGNLYGSTSIGGGGREVGTVFALSL